MVVGIVGAGAMGSALGARLRDGGARVVVALDGRSDRSRRLATEAGLEDVGSLAALVRESAIVLSVVPPEAAVEVATAVAAEAAGAAPLVADLNAIAPSTVAARSRRSWPMRASSSSTARSPARRRMRAGTTRLYLSGARARRGRRAPARGRRARRRSATPWGWPRP